MPTYSVPYAEFLFPPSTAFPEGRSAFVPFVELTLFHASRHLSCYAIVDSGSDHCIFPQQFLGLLNLDQPAAPAEMIAGVGGSAVSTHFFNVEIDLQGVARFPVYAGFTGGLDELGFGLLGQTGFLDRFNVHFQLAKRIFDVEII